MTAYVLPEEPKYTVYDCAGYKWEYNNFQGCYYCDDMPSLKPSWCKLLSIRGPITDAPGSVRWRRIHHRTLLSQCV